MIARALILGAALALTGCNQQLENFVGGSGEKKQDPLPVPVALGDSLDRTKVSAGAVLATSANLSLRAHITTTDQQLSGGGMSARIGISSARLR